jgi:hypothetical protein
MLGGVRHGQILDKLAAAGLVRALDEDLARWVGGSRGQVVDVEPVMVRWRCLLEDPAASEIARDKGWLALGTLLHRYGISDSDLTERAVAAVDRLNAAVALSDAFARQSPAIVALLRSAPQPLTRRPGRPQPVTFLRAGDVLSVRVGAGFHACWVRAIHGLHEYPIVEFYTGRFDRMPTADDLAGRGAAAERGRARFAVVGMSYLPDPARQVVAIDGRDVKPPEGGEPGPGDGLYTLTDNLRIQRVLTAW